jgi:hypothetical protein
MISSYFLRGNGFQLNLEGFMLNYQQNFVVWSHVLGIDEFFRPSPQPAKCGTLLA